MSNQKGNYKAPIEWRVKAQFGMRSGKITGYMVDRVHNPYTKDARVEVLRVNGKNVFRTEAEAQAAIAQAEKVPA